MNHEEPTLRSLLLRVATNALSPSPPPPPPPPHHHHHHPHHSESRYEFKGIIPYIKQTIFLFSLIATLNLTSVGMYCIFYQVVMPPKYINQPLYFDYGSVGSKKSVHDIAQEALLQNVNCACEKECPASVSKKSVESSMLTAVATTNLMQDHQWTPCTSSSVTSSSSSPPQHVLKPNKPHFIDLSLTLPSSSVNSNIGIFTIETSLHTSSSGETLAISRRSSMLPYRSNIVEVLEKGLWFQVFYVLGVWKEEREVTLDCFNHFVEVLDQPLTMVQVKLSLPPSTSSPTSPLQITSAQLKIGKECNIFQRFLKTWFFTCAFFGSSMFFGIQWCLFWMVRFCWDDYCGRLRENSRRRQEEGGYASGRGRSSEGGGYANHEFEPLHEEEVDDSDFIPLSEDPVLVEEDGEEEEDDASKEPVDENDKKDDDDNDDDDGSDGGGGATPSATGGNSSEKKDNTDKSSGSSGTKETGSTTPKHNPSNNKSKQNKQNTRHQRHLQTNNHSYHQEEKKEDDFKEHNTPKKKTMKQQDVINIMRLEKKQEALLADAVMKGYIGPYEIFTGE